MSRVVKLLFMIIIVASLFTGCTSIKEVKETKSVIPEINAQTALQLRNEAIAKYYAVFVDGGEQCTSSLDERLADKEEFYYYYCSDMDTKEKIKQYLKGSFTDTIVNHLLDTETIKMINGKLTYSPADVGSMLEWDQAKIKSITGSQTEKEITFEVPDVDGEIETIKFELQCEEDNRWKINTYPVEFL